jgi:hypothetical protein
LPLWFGNPHSETIYIALLTYDSGCVRQPWRKSGWYSLAGNSVIEVIREDLRELPTPYWCWFADLGADGPCWSGDHWYRVSHNAGFSKCYDDDTGCTALWAFRESEFVPGWSGMNIVLQEPGEANEANQGIASFVLLR